MMPARLISAAVLLLAPIAASAAVDPRPGPEDPRMRVAAYDPKQVLRVTSTALSPVQIVFESGEKVLSYAGALVLRDPKEAKDWLLQMAGNVLVLQPLRADLPPSMLFVHTTSPNGNARHYVYELRVRGGDIADAGDQEAYVSVEYTYPHDPTPEEKAAARTVIQTAAERRAQARLAAAKAMNAPVRNYAYSRRDPSGCPVLAPASVFDDGHQTVLTFAPHAVLPQVYALNADGKETVVNATNQETAAGTVVTVANVYREFRVRSGGRVCALRNDAYDPVGSQPGGGTGTISADVVRQVRAR